MLTLLLAFAITPEQAAMIQISERIVPRQPSPALMAAAQSHAEYLASTGRLEHSGANGTPLERARANGYTGHVEEVLAGDFSCPENAFNGWLNSTVGHRDALLGPATECGFGCATGPRGRVYCGLFGSAAPSPATAERTDATNFSAVAFYGGTCGPAGCGQGTVRHVAAPVAVRQRVVRQGLPILRRFRRQ